MEQKPPGNNNPPPQENETIKAIKQASPFLNTIDLRKFPTTEQLEERKKAKNNVSTLGKRPVISLFRMEEAQQAAKSLSADLADGIKDLKIDLEYCLAELKSKLISDVLTTFLGRPVLPSDYLNFQWSADEKDPEILTLYFKEEAFGTIAPTRSEDAAFGYEFNLLPRL